MIVKFFQTNKKTAQGAAEYLIGKENSDEPRPMARTLKGNPFEVAMLADNLKFNTKHTVGCLSFSEPDIPENEKEELIKSFEKTFFAGVEEQNYSIAWVEHKDKGRLELNFIIANVELSTGKRLQPYYHFSKDKKLCESWKNYINAKYGYTDPNDPKRTQSLRQNIHNIHKNKQAGVISNTESLHNNLMQQVAMGNIKTRDDVVRHIEDLGIPIKRQQDNYISVLFDGDKRPTRLKGALYEKSFDALAFQKLVTTTNLSVVSPDITALKSDLDACIRLRFEENKKKYKSNISDNDAIRIKLPKELKDKYRAIYTESFYRKVLNNDHIQEIYSEYPIQHLRTGGDIAQSVVGAIRHSERTSEVIDRTQQQLDRANGVIDDSKQQISRASGAIDGTQQGIDNREKGNRPTEELITESERQIEQSKQQTTQATERINRTNRELESRKRTASTNECELTRHREHIKRLEQHYQQQQHERKQRERKELENQAREYEQFIRRCYEQQERLREQTKRAREMAERNDEYARKRDEKNRTTFAGIIGAVRNAITSIKNWFLDKAESKLLVNTVEMQDGSEVAFAIPKSNVESFLANYDDDTIPSLVELAKHQKTFKQDIKANALTQEQREDMEKKEQQLMRMVQANNFYRADEKGNPLLDENGRKIVYTVEDVKDELAGHPNDMRGYAKLQLKMKNLELVLANTHKMRGP